MDKQTQIELEAAAFRQLQTHLMQKRTDVQNIDLMNLIHIFDTVSKTA